MGTLDLSNMNIQNIHEEIILSKMIDMNLDFTTVTHLNLSNNKIVSVDGISLFTNLIYLNLSHNYISSLSDDFFPPSLEYLDVSYNKLSDLNFSPSFQKTANSSHSDKRLPFSSSSLDSSPYLSSSAISPRYFAAKYSCVIRGAGGKNVRDEDECGRNLITQSNLKRIDANNNQIKRLTSFEKYAFIAMEEDEEEEENDSDSSNIDEEEDEEENNRKKIKKEEKEKEKIMKMHFLSSSSSFSSSMVAKLLLAGEEIEEASIQFEIDEYDYAIFLFEKLEVINLQNNPLQTLKGITPFKNIKILDLSSTKISNAYELRYLSLPRYVPSLSSSSISSIFPSNSLPGIWKFRLQSSIGCVAFSLKNIFLKNNKKLAQDENLSNIVAEILQLNYAALKKKNYFLYGDISNSSGNLLNSFNENSFDGEHIYDTYDEEKEDENGEEEKTDRIIKKKEKRNPFGSDMYVNGEFDDYDDYDDGEEEEEDEYKFNVYRHGYENYKHLSNRNSLVRIDLDVPVNSTDKIDKNQFSTHASNYFSSNFKREAQGEEEEEEKEEATTQEEAEEENEQHEIHEEEEEEQVEPEIQQEEEKEEKNNELEETGEKTQANIKTNKLKEEENKDEKEGMESITSKKKKENSKIKRLLNDDELRWYFDSHTSQGGESQGTPSSSVCSSPLYSSSPFQFSSSPCHSSTAPSPLESPTSSASSFQPSSFPPPSPSPPSSSSPLPSSSSAGTHVSSCFPFPPPFFSSSFPTPPAPPPSAYSCSSEWKEKEKERNGAKITKKEKEEEGKEEEESAFVHTESLNNKERIATAEKTRKKNFDINNKEKKEGKKLTAYGKNNSDDTYCCYAEESDEEKRRYENELEREKEKEKIKEKLKKREKEKTKEKEREKELKYKSMEKENKKMKIELLRKNGEISRLKIKLNEVVEEFDKLHKSLEEESKSAIKKKDMQINQLFSTQQALQEEIFELNKALQQKESELEVLPMLRKKVSRFETYLTSIKKGEKLAHTFELEKEIIIMEEKLSKLESKLINAEKNYEIKNREAEENNQIIQQLKNTELHLTEKLSTQIVENNKLRNQVDYYVGFINEFRSAMTFEDSQHPHN